MHFLRIPWTNYWRRLKLISVLGIVGASALLVSVVLAQVVMDEQQARGDVSFRTLSTSISADLYICEPDTTTGPDCGSDDEGPNEIVFEGNESVLPEDEIFWDIRLRNVGNTDWTIGELSLLIEEVNDPNGGCQEDILRDGFNPSGDSSLGGVFILGKDGDVFNDNGEGPLDGSAKLFRIETGSSNSPIVVAAGDYEDVRLRLRIAGVNFADTVECLGNQWDATWQFQTLPLIDLG